MYKRRAMSARTRPLRKNSRAPQGEHGGMLKNQFAALARGPEPSFLLLFLLRTLVFFFFLSPSLSLLRRCREGERGEKIALVVLADA